MAHTHFTITNQKALCIAACKIAPRIMVIANVRGAAAFVNIRDHASNARMLVRDRFGNLGVKAKAA